MNHQIISASRRTDIPAFFGSWLLEQVRQGWCDVPNPFSKKLYRVDLSPETVGAIVFWSKNYQPFFPILKTINPLYNNRFLFHFTINGYTNRAKNILEPNVADTEATLQTAEQLANNYGKEKLLWRFDPVVFSNLTSPEERLEQFEYLADKMHHFTNRCYFSFVDLYGKVTRRFSKAEQPHEFQFIKPSIEGQLEFTKKLKAIADSNNIQLFACCEPEIADTAKILKASCIDAELLQKLYPEQAFTLKQNPTRTGCGCFESKDIGTYRTCGHHCLYCYAN